MNEMKERVAKAIEGAMMKGGCGAPEAAHAAIAAIHKFLGDYFVEDWPAVIDEALKEPKDDGQ